MDVPVCFSPDDAAANAERSASTRPRDPDDPAWKSVELVQRGRMILDVARTDLDESERRLGSFHATTWHFRQALDEARRSWDHLRAELGSRALAASLAEPPLAVLPLTRGGSEGAEVVATLILLGGKTYSVERVPGTELAPIQYRLSRLPPEDDGDYYACRLHDGSTQCDCADWIYQVAGIPGAHPCKHLTGLVSLGWL